MTICVADVAYLEQPYVEVPGVANSVLRPLPRGVVAAFL
jgi:hypothetical protein